MGTDMGVLGEFVAMGNSHSERCVFPSFLPRLPLCFHRPLPKARIYSTTPMFLRRKSVPRAPGASVRTVGLVTADSVSYSALFYAIFPAPPLSVLTAFDM